jgi:hypothetical protein
VQTKKQTNQETHLQTNKQHANIQTNIQNWQCEDNPQRYDRSLPPVKLCKINLNYNSNKH